MAKYFQNIKDDLQMFSSEQFMITVSRSDLQSLVSNYDRLRNKRTVATREIELNEYEQDKLYCIKDDNSYVFSLANNKYSLSVANANQVKEILKFESGIIGQEPLKTEIISTMKSMIKELNPEKTNQLER